ncbi:uncharacterized protein LOC124448765 isoform X3 [Xenia sp. Carnegie-2017]|uniref:uncharacterized protein LOC124448765 isoform X3 n=1 Tax=Xenia sp. Carnegie-2017 TaxID=2897299 RepID=UPI001F04BB0C|nr:uncharacterized protein LOC124448765 isoform X3 [Xenia sp. Carnegie-2017]
MSSTGFQLMKEWKGYEVEMHVRNAFGDKLKDHNIDIEIVMSVHNTLHPPCLAPNQTLNGFMVHKVLKDKPIYVRLSVQILEPLSNRINKPEHLNDQEELCIVQDDSSDDEFLRSAFTNEPPCISSYQHPGVEERSEVEVTNNPPAVQETSLPSVGTISDCSHNNGNVQNEVQPEDPNSVDMSNISGMFVKTLFCIKMRFK